MSWLSDAFCSLGLVEVFITRRRRPLLHSFIQTKPARRLGRLAWARVLVSSLDRSMPACAPTWQDGGNLFSNSVSSDSLALHCSRCWRKKHHVRRQRLLQHVRHRRRNCLPHRSSGSFLSRPAFF